MFYLIMRMTSAEGSSIEIHTRSSAHSLQHLSTRHMGVSLKGGRHIQVPMFEQTPYKRGLWMFANTNTSWKVFSCFTLSHSDSALAYGVGRYARHDGATKMRINRHHMKHLGTGYQALVGAISLNDIRRLPCFPTPTGLGFGLLARAGPNIAPCAGIL